MARALASKRLIVAWALLRLPLLAACAYLLRYPLLDWIERRWEISGVTMFAIDVLSTPAVRTIYALLVALVVLASARVLRGRAPAVQVAGLMLIALVLFAASFTASGTPRKHSWLALLLVLTNFVPAAWRTRVRPSPALRSGLFLAGVGVAELFLLQPYLDWLRAPTASSNVERPARGSTLGTGLAAVLVGLVAALSLSGVKLVDLERSLRGSAAVRVLDRADFNYLVLDRGQRLSVTGHGLPRLRRYDVPGVSRPLEANVESAGAQSLTRDLAGNLYLVNEDTKEVLVLDGETLALVQRMPVPELSPGDATLAVDPSRENVAVASEADEEVGTPFLLLERASGKIVARGPEQPAYMLPHPSKPYIYVSFFRRRRGVILYDTSRRTIIAQAQADSRVDGMAFWAAGSEVLVASPMESRVLRYDAETLAPKGAFAVNFGTRSVAVDARRNLLLCASLVTGRLGIFDLRDGTQRATYYLGRWLRQIVVRDDRPTAYVSSNGALYQVDY